MAERYKNDSPYLNSFMGEDWKESHGYASPASMKTNNLKLGNPNNFADPRSNPQVKAASNLTSPQTIADQKKKYVVPTNMENALSLRNQSVKDGVDGGYDFYQQGINKQGAGGDIYSKFNASNWDMNSQAGVDMTSNFGSNLEVGNALSANPSSPTFELPNFANQGYGPKTPGQYQEIGSDPTMDYEKALDLSAVKNEQDRQAAAVDNIWDPGLPTTEGLGNNLSMTTVANPKNTLAKPTRPDTSGLSSYDEFDDKAEMALDQNEYEDLFGRSQFKDVHGTDHRGVTLNESTNTWEPTSPEAGTFEDMAIDQNFATDAMGDTGATEAASTLGDKLGKAMAFAPLIGAIGGLSQSQSAIKDLTAARQQAEGAQANLANAKDAEFAALSEKHSEDRRRVGALERDRVAGNLEKIQETKTGGLVSGQKLEMSEDVLDTAHTRTDISLARLEDERNQAEASIHTANKQEREKLKQTIAELDAKIKEQKKESIMGPIGAIVDVGSNLLMASNPALAIGMQVGKSLIS